MVEPTDKTPHWQTPLSDFAIICITGGDSGAFLQGQLTCDIGGLSDDNSSFCALADCKGRVVSTLLVYRHRADFCLIAPKVLADKIITTLRQYILRADVQIDYCKRGFAITGVCPANCDPHPSADFAATTIGDGKIIKLASTSRYLYIGTPSNLPQVPQSRWHWHDISAGIAWLDERSTGQYTPQMLNIDKWGGVSFSKGCYTGQEVIARTHYLGKAKRHLRLAEGTAVCGDSTVDGAGLGCGKVLAACCGLLLLVLADDASDVAIGGSKQRLSMLDFTP